ncbi:MAG TPA: UrcA family protein [Steroidobacteraceae bacterium]|nr:UrcA family protein [Steroidobacteraceae bacterium]
MARPTLAIIAAGLGGWLLASTAFASASADANAVRVSYSDLDLTKDAGVERLYGRLRHAAEQACGGALDNRDLSAQRQHDACVRSALDRAVEDVHSSRLTARHKGMAAGAQYARVN